MTRLSCLIILSSLSMASCVMGEGGELGAQVAELQELGQDSNPSLLKVENIERLVVDDNQNPTFIVGQLGQELTAVSAFFGTDARSLKLLSSDTDSLGYQVKRYEQTQHGLPVIGGDFRVTRKIDGSIHAVSGVHWQAEVTAPAPQISLDEASALAVEGTPGATKGRSGQLVYIAASNGKAPVLAWQVEVSGVRDDLPLRDSVYMDAQSGALVDRHPQIHSARLRETYNAQGIEEVGVLARDEFSLLSGDKDVDLAHEGAEVTYQCLQELFGRDSYDGHGARLMSVAHFGYNIENAFWDGNMMIYGDNFAIVDVGTHEFGHALTANTGRMVYQNEPGALNEAWSDILAAICDVHSKGSITQNTWDLGEELPLGAIRYLSDPTRDGISRDHYETRFVGKDDFGGVHINSGIANLAFYLLTTGGMHPQGRSSQEVIGLGIEDAGQIFYRALTTYMNSNTNFLGARAATEQAAVDLFGAQSDEVVSVGEAWFAVGVGEPASQRKVEPEQGQGDGDGNPSPELPGNEDPGGQSVGTVTGGCAASQGASSMPMSVLLLLGLVLFGRQREKRLKK